MSSASWVLKHTDSFGYNWHADGGAARFAAAMEIIDEAAARPCGRLSGMVFPGQVDTCTEEFLKKAVEAAARRGAGGRAATTASAAGTSTAPPAGTWPRAAGSREPGSRR